VTIFGHIGGVTLRVGRSADLGIQEAVTIPVMPITAKTCAEIFESFLEPREAVAYRQVGHGG